MSKRWLRLIAPFRCQFSLNSAKMVEKRKQFNAYLDSLSSDGKVDENQFPGASRGMIMKTAKMIEKSDEFNAFLKTFNSDFRTAGQRLFPDVPQGIMIEALLQSRDEDAASRYVSLDRAGSLYSSPKYLSISFGEVLHHDLDTFLKDAARKADTVCAKPLSTTLSPDWKAMDVAIYDNTIAILTLDVAIADDFDPENWTKLDEWTTRLVVFFLSRLYKGHIYPALRGVNQYAAEHAETRVRRPEEYDVFYDMSGQESDPTSIRVQWVSRTLICPKGMATSDWASRSMDSARAIHAHGDMVHLSVGNNVIETASDKGAHDLSAVWQAVYLAQYYYAVLDVAGKNLNRFISSPYDKKSNRELHAWSRTMDAVINVITIIQVEYRDLVTELQGLPKTVFRRLEKEWELDALLASVESKCNLCKSHFQLLNAYISQRDRSRSERLLTAGVGVLFVGLMAGISAYGHALKREGYEEDVFGLLNIAQLLSPNIMIWIGIALAVAVGLFVWFNRVR